MSFKRLFLTIGLVTLLAVPVASTANQGAYKLQMRHQLNNQFPEPGDVIIAKVTVINRGIKPIPLIKVNYRVEGAQSFFGTPPGQTFRNLQPGRKATMALAIKVMDYASGRLCQTATVRSRVFLKVMSTRLCIKVQAPKDGALSPP